MIRYFKDHPQLFVAFIASLLSIGAWFVFYQLGLTTIYNDAMSHLNVARLVVDNLQPGMSQLGSVWLPASHILSLPLIWNDFLWHSGLAGSLISMVSFVLSAIGIYRIVVALTDVKRAGIFAAITFSVCLNMLYLQATPLTEPMYVALFIFSILFMILYIKNQSSKSLIALGVVSGIGILTRYDAWFVAAVIGLIVLTNELFIRRQPLQSSIGYGLLYALPILFAALLWLGWNLLIFGDPLYSFTGPYSARAQQTLIESSSGLITKHDIGMSSWAYLLSIMQNVGITMSIIGTLGWAIFLCTQRRYTKAVNIFAGIGMLSIVAFNILALYLGFSILNLPELGWNPSGTSAGELFNVRYGILALPFIAVGIGLLVSQVHKWQILIYTLLVIAILAQVAMTYMSGIITLEDGQIGSSAFVNQDISDALKTQVKSGEKVIMSTSSYNAVAFESGLDLKSFIHEGVSAQWNGAISQPEKYGTWIVIANNDVGEPIHSSLVVRQKNAFLNNYERVFTGTYASLYKRK